MAKKLSDLFDDLMPPRERSYFSVGATCHVLGITPQQLHTLMTECGARFDRTVDGIPYLDGRQFEAVSAKCAEIRTSIATKIEAAKAAMPNN